MNLKEIIQQPQTTLIDVREPMEVLFGKVDGAINIPLGTIPNKLDEIKAINEPVVLYCRSGNRSAQAYQYLISQGVTEVYDGGSLEHVKALLNKVTV